MSPNISLAFLQCNSSSLISHQTHGYICNMLSRSWTGSELTSNSHWVMNSSCTAWRYFVLDTLSLYLQYDGNIAGSLPGETAPEPFRSALAVTHWQHFPVASPFTHLCCYSLLTMWDYQLDLSSVWGVQDGRSTARSYPFISDMTLVYLRYWGKGGVGRCLGWLDT